MASKAKKSRPSSSGPTANTTTNPSFDLKHHAFPDFKPTCTYIGEQHFKPLNTTNLNKDQDITFDIDVPEYMFLHPTENPFLMTYIIKDAEGNPITPGIPAYRDKEQNFLAMSSALGAGCFFDNVTIELNGVPLLSQTGDYVGPHDFLYTTANRLFSTKAERKALMGKDTLLLNSDDWVTDGKKDKKSDRQEGEMQNVDFVSATPAGAVPQVSCFGFDSVPFCGASNFCLNKLRKRSNENAILRPNSKLVIRLYKTQPFYKKLLWVFNENKFVNSKEKDFAYAEGDNTVGKYTLEIKSLVFRMRSIQSVKQEEIKAGLKHINMYYDVDTVHLNSATLLPNHGQTETKLLLQPDTKLVYLMFLRDHVLWPPHGKCTIPVVPWFVLPNEIVKMDITLDGGPIQFMADGMKNLSPGEISHSPSAVAYHHYLTEKGFVDYSFNEMFPRKNWAFNQLIVLDLTKQKLADRPVLRVAIQWKDTSPERMNVTAVGVKTNTVCIEPSLHTFFTAK